MKKSRIAEHPSTRPKQGSALLLTLLVVSLLLVMVLAFVVTVRMELRKVVEQQNLVTARANARLGAHLALAELQRTMGPDQRVSARAEILSSANPDGHRVGEQNQLPFNSALSTRFWTGTWNSEAWNPGDVSDRTNRFLSWLISLPDDSHSGNILSVQEGSLPFDLADDTQFVTLANIESERVRAAQRAITTPGSTQATGAYAWWVSDEGVKVNPGLSDPYRGQQQGNVIADIPRFLFPNRENFAATEWLQNVDFDNEALIEKLRKVASSHLSLDLALTGADLSVDAESAMIINKNTIFADYSFLTHGVLSSNRRGGLRSDLSLAFWRDRSQVDVYEPGTPDLNAAFENDFRRRRIFNFQDYPQSEQTVRSPAAADRRFHAPRWEVLRDYHTQFQKVVNPGTANAFVRPWINASGNPMPRSSLGPDGTSSFNIQFEQATGDHLHNFTPSDPDDELVVAAVRVERVTNPVSPILLRMNLQFELATIPKRVDGDGNQIYQPEMRLVPTFTFWNPYNVAISNEAMNGSILPVAVQELNFGIGGGGMQMIFDIDGETFPLVGGDSDDRLTISGSILRFQLNSSSPAVRDFEAGEIRVYSASEISSMDNANMINHVQLTPIFPAVEGYFTMNETLSRIEKVAGDTLTVSTTFTNVGAGPRPTTWVGGTEGLTHRFRIKIPSDFGPETTSLTVDGLNTVVLGSMELHMRPGSDQATHTFNPRRFANFNLRALSPKGGFMNTYDGEIPQYWFGFIGGPTEVDFDKRGVVIPGGTLQRGFWGRAANSAEGDTFLTFFDVPRRPVESIGHYQHAYLNGLYPHMPTYPLGNSLADPHIRKPYAVDRFNDRTFMDLSWFLNDQIWDDYFISTIDPYDVDGLNPSRLAPLRDRFVELDTTVVYDERSATDYQTVAENLLLRGAFNINSTSVEAWAAFLSGLGGEGIAYLNPETGTFANTAGLDHPFHRLSLPIGEVDTAWTGGPRNLSRAEIRELAENMVLEVKRRGPFLSLSDFVNRRLSDDDRGFSGALQSAIDELPDSTRSVVADSESLLLPSAPVSGNHIGKPLDFAPGHLTQADVLTGMGPFMTVRSDTFVIRSYGRTPGDTGQASAEVWTEMVVQRFPDEHEFSPMGRPFHIISFRYLNKDEI